MTRNWNWFLLPAILFVALASCPPVALGGGDGQEPKKDKLDMIQDQLKKLVEQVNSKYDSLNGSLIESFEKIAKDMAKFKKDIQSLNDEKTLQTAKVNKLEETIKALENSLTTAQLELGVLKMKMDSVKLGPPVDKGDLQEIRFKLEQLEKTLAQLKETPPYTAKSSPSGTCKVVLINNTSEEITVLLNKMSYRVGPGAAINVEKLPSGGLSYEVLHPNYGSIRRNTTTLNPNEVFNIKVG